MELHRRLTRHPGVGTPEASAALAFWLSPFPPFCVRVSVSVCVCVCVQRLLAPTATCRFVDGYSLCMCEFTNHVYVFTPTSHAFTLLYCTDTKHIAVWILSVLPATTRRLEKQKR